MTTCCVCGELCKGSIGAAGIHWNNICQECKDEEDRILRDSLMGVCVGLDLIETARIIAPGDKEENW